MNVNFSRQPADFAVSVGIGFATERSMLDLILLATALIFFAVAIGYTYACDRL